MHIWRRSGPRQLQSVCKISLFAFRVGSLPGYRLQRNIAALTYITERQCRIRWGGYVYATQSSLQEEQVKSNKWNKGRSHSC